MSSTGGVRGPICVNQGPLGWVYDKGYVYIEAAAIQTHSLPLENAAVFRYLVVSGL